MWALTGLWHGASLNFVAWGLFFWAFLMLERLFLGKALEWLNQHHLGILGLLYSWLVFMTAWVFFREETLSDAARTIASMFCWQTGDVTAAGSLSIPIVLLVIAGILLSGFVQKWIPKLRERRYDKTRVSIPEYVFLLVLLMISVFRLISSSYNAFIYFRF